MQYEIRALKVGEVLDESVQLMKNHFGLLFGIMACTMVPAQFAQLLFQLNITPQVQNGRAMPPADPIMMIVWGLIVILISIVVFPLANAAVIYALGSAYLSRPVTLGECLAHGIRRWVPMMWTSFLMGVIVFFGLCLCIVPGIIFALWYTLAQEVTILEGVSGPGALSRSKALMKGNMGDAFVLGLVVFAINFGIGVGSAFVPEPHLAALVTAVLQGVTTVFGTAAVVVFYFSARCKHENFDLQLLAEAVDDDGSAGPSEPTSW